jgi:hypothetical protein
VRHEAQRERRPERQRQRRVVAIRSRNGNAPAIALPASERAARDRNAGALAVAPLASGPSSHVIVGRALVSQPPLSET